jgi:hypothetical protein
VKYIPFPYQSFTTQFILDHAAVGILLDMGMGKTVTTLTAIALLMYDYFVIRRVLIIAPKKPALETWPAELAKWDHLQELTYSVACTEQADQRARIAAVRADTDITIINEDNVTWLVNWLKENRIRWPWDMVVVDELSKFKSATSDRFRKLRRVRKHIKRIVGLTGTPAPNGLIDLWAQMYLLDEGAALGRTLIDYREQYFRVTKYANGYPVRWEPKPGAEAEIYRRLESLCVSMKSEGHLDLPERLYIAHPVVLSAATMSKYRQMERDMLLELPGGVIDAGSAAIVGNKLLQLAGGACYDSAGQTLWLHDAKMEEFAQRLEEANGQPVLVAYNFRHELERLKRAYPEAVEIRDGARGNDSVVQRWNRGEIPILLAHPASAGHGLNLQDGGHITIWYSPPWNLEHYQQFNKRLHRPGQRKAVLIRHLIAEGTIDEYVMRVLCGKEQTQDNLIDALRARLEEYA